MNVQARTHRLALTILVACLSSAVAGNFLEGEFVPTARRGQFHSTRTLWHDLLGRHCPRFERHTKVAIPVPQPKGFKSIYQNYKIQFSFDGDRIVTPWVPILGKRCPKAPIVRIELEHTDNVLTAARAEVRPVAAEYLHEHQNLLQEFQNATHWPKHLLVEYTWKHNNPINLLGGLYVVFASGILITAALGLSVLISYQDKLQAFLADLADEAQPSLNSGDFKESVIGSVHGDENAKVD